MRVGFIGLGRMGRAMAGRVLAGGFDLAVHNRTPERCAELIADGARGAATVAQACEGALWGITNGG